MSERALITCITGQDGSYLAELLRSQNKRPERGHALGHRHTPPGIPVMTWRMRFFLMNVNSQSFDSLVANETSALLINIGSGSDQTRREFAHSVAEVGSFKGLLSPDPNKPDGSRRKLLDNSRLSSLRWQPRLNLSQSLELTYQDFLKVHSLLQPTAKASF